MHRTLRNRSMKVEPKVWMANERTLIAWLQMSVTMGMVAAGLLGTHQQTAVPGDAYDVDTVAEAPSVGTARLVGLILLPLSVAVAIYATLIFYWRLQMLREKQVAPFMDTVGPGVLACSLLAALCAIFYVHL